MKLIQSLKVAFVLVAFGFAATAYAGDAKVEADITQNITNYTLETSSDEGEAETHLGSIVAHDNSQVKASAKNEIKTTTVRTSTNDGLANASVGSIVAGK